MLELWCIYSTVIVQALALVKYQMDENCGGGKKVENGLISFQFSPYNNKHFDCKFELWSPGDGFLLAFLRVDLFSSLCAEGRIIFKRYHFIVADNDVPGIPSPLCGNNLPWSSFPTRVYTSDRQYLEVRFQGEPATSSDTSFELMAVSYYINSHGCEENEFRCNNHRCIPKSAHNCDIDWCGDGSGCDGKADSDGALIAGLCGGLGAVIIVVLLGVCIAYYARNKNNSLDSNPGFVCTRRRDDGRRRCYVDRLGSDDGRRRRTERHNQIRQITPDPPTYESVQNSTMTSYDRSSHPSPGASEFASVAHQSDSAVTETDTQSKADKFDNYEPPPPEYDLVIHHKDMYYVKETDRS